MDSKEKILETIQGYLNSVLIKRDVHKAEQYLAEEVVCWELNTPEYLTSKQQVLQNLQEKINKSVKNKSIDISEYTVNEYSNMAVFIGLIVIDSDEFTGRERAAMHYSATLRLEDEWRICAGHYSVEENKEEGFLGFTEGNIAGGILSSYVQEDGFKLRYINENLLKLLGYTKEEFWEKYGDNAMSVVYHGDALAVEQQVKEAVKDKKDWRLIHRIETKDGRILHMLVRGRQSLDASGRKIMTNFSIDMTDMYLLQEKVARQAEELEAQNEELVAQQEELEAQNEELTAQTEELIFQSKELTLSEKKFRIALAKTKNIIFDYDICGETILLYNLSNPKLDKIIPLHLLEEELIEKEYVSLEDKEIFSNMFLYIKQGDMSVKQDIQMITEEGNKKWYQFLLIAIYDSEGEPIHAIGTAEDITIQKRQEIDLRYKAESDLLTGMYNKISVMEKIEKSLEESQGIQSSAFMIIDIDHFKDVNDIYGHPWGDKILKEVARVLKNNFRETDILGRLGGDEFCIYVSGSKNIHLIRQKAEAIHQEIREIRHPGENAKNLSVSIGITTCSGIGKNFEEVYKEADNALYQAKQKGRDTYCFYENY